MKQKHHMIKTVERESIAEEMGIRAGDELLEISGQKIEDIFDYQYLCMEEYLEVLIKKANGEEWLLEIEKEEREDLGIVFENGLMDEYHSCHNHCIFCFIDQMPPGMRKTLYFKDDDARLSFLQGNYVTLTNLDEHDIERIIRYRLEPINISFQTMNPELRCKMLNNRFAGEALKKADQLFEAGIRMNGQIVLCKGMNDGAELRYSLEKLFKYLPVLESVSVVPVGLSKYREGLYPLEPFTKEDACDVIDVIEEYQKKARAVGELHFVHASDEWYILAERELPEKERYDGYLQLENGVGMLRVLIDETHEEIERYAKRRIRFPKTELSMATGMLAYDTILSLTQDVMAAFPMFHIMVYPIRNDFFGEMITVSGLITGQDLIAQLKGKPLGERLLLPENMLRSGEDVFLDDLTVTDVQNALQVPVDIVKSSSMGFVQSILQISE